MVPNHGTHHILTSKPVSSNMKECEIVSENVLGVTINSRYIFNKYITSYSKEIFWTKVLRIYLLRILYFGKLQKRELYIAADFFLKNFDKYQQYTYETDLTTHELL